MGDNGKHFFVWRRGHPPLVPSFHIFSESWFKSDEFDIWILKSSKSENFYTKVSSFGFYNLLFLIFMSLSTFLPNMMVIEPFANSFFSSAKSDTNDRHDGNGGISPILMVTNYLQKHHINRWFLQISRLNWLLDSFNHNPSVFDSNNVFIEPMTGDFDCHIFRLSSGRSSQSGHVIHFQPCNWSIMMFTNNKYHVLLFISYRMCSFMSFWD